MIPMNERGELIIDEYENLLNERTKMVAVAHVSNSLGTVNPVKEMIATAHKFGVPVWSTRRKACRIFRSMCRTSTRIFLYFRDTRCSGRRAAEFLYGKREWLDQMPPYQTGGGMIRTVSFEKTTFAPIPGQVRGRNAGDRRRHRAWSGDRLYKFDRF